MNLSSEGVIDLLHGNGPICPNAMLEPLHPSHAMHIRLSNVVYKNTPHDEDGKPTTPELAKVDHEVSYGRAVSDRMNLYRDVVSVLQGSMPVAVEALFFRCGICGLVLPANRVPGQ